MNNKAILENEIIMRINSNCFMKMIANRPIIELCLCDCAPLILSHPLLNNFKLARQSSTFRIFDMLTSIKCTLEAALMGRLILPSLSHNIGYLACEKYHLAQKDRSAEHDLIDKYYFVENPQHTFTWLYEISGSFFIEITPLYPWEYCDPQPGEEYCTYEAFMASYKSILTIPLERADVERLYQQTSQLSDEILAREMAERIKYYETHYKKDTV